MSFTFDLNHGIDLGCFKVKFRSSCISGIVCLIDVNWPHPWPWPWSFKVRVWKSLISGIGQLIDMERKRCESPISWPWYWLVWHGDHGRMYWIVTGVTSDVGVRFTYLVIIIIIIINHYHQSLSSSLSWPSISEWFLKIIIITTLAVL